MTRGPRCYWLKVAVLGALFGCRADGFEPRAVTRMSDAAVMASVETSDTLEPIADAHTRTFAPNKNYGTGDSLTVRSFSADANNRYSVYVRFDQAAITNQVGTGQLDSARLELMLRDGSALPVAGDWLNAYRIPSSWAPGGWTEQGITSNCPNDTNVANATLNCPGGVWDTTGFGTLAPTSRALIKKDTRGWVGFDVTADIAAFLAGTANQGWYLAKENNNNNERIVFWSRESAQKPRLILFVTGDSSFSLSSFLDPGVTGAPGSADETHPAGAIVNYSYSVQPGYTALTVTLDGQVVPASGTVRMNQSHLLVAYARPSVQLSAGGQAVKQRLETVLASPTQANYQAHLDGIIDLSDAVGAVEAGRQTELAYELAIDPVADSSALRLMDEALANKVFYIKPGSGATRGASADTLDRMIYLYVNGIQTSRKEAGITSGQLAIMIYPKTHFRVDVDSVLLLYNRTRLEQFPSDEEQALLCSHRLTNRFTQVLPAEVWRDAYNTCMQNPNPSINPDILEAILEYMSVAGRGYYLPADADSLAKVIQNKRNRGTHVIVMAHSQGNLLLHQASNGLSSAGKLTLRDSVGFAAIAMASPTSFGFPPPLDEHHLKYVVASGDPVPLVGVLGLLPPNVTTPIATPMSDEAAAEISRAAALGPPGVLLAAYLKAKWGFYKLHDVNIGYLGQAPTSNKVSAWVDTLHGELVVGEVTGGSPLTISVGSTAELGPSIVVMNQNGRQIYGRKLVWRSSNVAVASVDSIGHLKGTGPGAATVTARRGKDSTSFAITVPAPPTSIYGRWGDGTLPAAVRFGPEVSGTVAVELEVISGSFVEKLTTESGTLPINFGLVQPTPGEPSGLEQGATFTVYLNGGIYRLRVTGNELMGTYTGPEPDNLTATVTFTYLGRIITADSRIEVP